MAVIGQAVLQTKATMNSGTPDTGYINAYNATAGQINANLRALSLCNVGANLMVQKVDSSGNSVVFTCAGSDEFDNGTTTVALTAPGEARTLQVVSLDGGVTKFWKIVNVMVAQAIPTGTRSVTNYVAEYHAGVSVPAGATGATVTVIGGGGGGGSGRRGASSTVRNGGSGGGGGGFCERYVPAAQMGATYTVDAGARGTGGGAMGTNGTNGNNGGDGGPSYVVFAGGFAIAEAGGAAGMGGTAAATSDVGGGRGRGAMIAGGTGGMGCDSFQGPGTAWDSSASSWVYDSIDTGFRGHSIGPGGGGGGSGITTGNAAAKGGNGADCSFSAQYGGAGGVVGGAAPTSGDAAKSGTPGGGAGGGAGKVSGSGNPGANATGYGGGGGGGGASVDGSLSGSGGNGGPGHVRIVWEF